MNPILLDLGFIQIYWYSVMILLGLLLGSFLIIKESKRFNIQKEYIINLIFYAMIFAIIGARLYYVLFNFDYYSKNLLDIFKIWEGGLAIHGGIISGLLFILFYTKKYKVNTWIMLDIIAPGLIIGQAIGRWGNFFNGEAHGGVVSLEFLNSLHLPQFIIDGMHLNGLYYHPTFLYESLWCLLGFIILLIYRRTSCKIGQVSSLYFIWYGIGRFLIESLRTDSLMLGQLKIAQVVSIILIIIGVIIFIIKNKDSKYNSLENKHEIRF